jgi:hypothetical protein
MKLFFISRIALHCPLSRTNVLHQLTSKGRKGVIGILVDSEIVLSTRYGKARVFINKTSSTETAYQQDLINGDRLLIRLDSW